MEKNQLTQKEGVLWIRFIGDNLETRSIPVYELGQVLISLQQIVYKTYLYKKGRLESRGLTKDEREQSALQISYHEKGSDIYGITSFLSDPTVNTILMEMLKAMGVYAVKKLIDILKKKKPEKKDLKELPADRLHSAFIFEQVLNIFKRLESTGKISAIEISIKLGTESFKIELKTDTKKNVRDLRDETILGEKEEIIEGTVTRLYLRQKIVYVLTEDDVHVKVKLTEDHFRNIRFNATLDKTVKFTVRPRYRFGMERLKTDEYEAESVEIIE